MHIYVLVFYILYTVHVYIPLQEEVHAPSVAEASPSDPQVLHETKVFHLVTYYLLIKPT